MGPRLEDVAESLSSTVPKRSRCYAAEPRFADFLRRKSAERETEFRNVAPEEVDREEMEGFAYVELPDNVALALAVCMDLGVDRETALEGMRRVKPDPGALVPMVIREGDREIEFLNLFAANDPESTAYLWQHLGLGERGETSMALVNIRADRMRRSKDLAPLFGRQVRAARYLLIGEMTGVFADMLHRNGVPKESIVDMGGKSAEYVWTRILTLAGEGRTSVVGLANIGGAGVELMELLEKKEKAA
jgi:poly-gamma-glutamate synthase PgsB/CapB